MSNNTVNLPQSYRSVRRITRRSGSNFYRSFALLAKEKRSAMEALYAFSRITDDLGDCNQPLALRNRWLEHWRQATALNLIRNPNSDQVFLPPGLPDRTDDWPIDLVSHAQQIMPALADTVQRFNIPSRYLLEIIDGVVADQQKTRFDTFEQLEHYCYLVASSVGLACLHIWGFRDPLPEQAAIDCGVAFQLTNIVRDISEDAQRGRIYLPRQHYAQHGLHEDDLLHPRQDDRLACLIEDELKRAEALYLSGWEVYHSLEPDGQRVFSMMWRTYRKLLERLKEDPRQIVTRRIRLTFLDRLTMAANHFIPPLYRRLPCPPNELNASNPASTVVRSQATPNDTTPKNKDQQ